MTKERRQSYEETLNNLNNVKNKEGLIIDLEFVNKKGPILKQYGVVKKYERYNKKALNEFIIRQTIKLLAKEDMGLKPTESPTIYNCIDEQFKAIPFGESIQIVNTTDDQYYIADYDIYITKERLEHSFEKIENKEEIEIVLALDTTGSMSEYRDKIRKEFDIIINEILSKYSNVKLSIIQFGDYIDYPKHIKIGTLTNNLKELQKQLKSFDTYGGDSEEFYEYVLNQINENKVQFSKNSKKVVILLFDNDYHKFEFEIDKVSEITNGNFCKFDIDTEIISFLVNNILLYGITVNYNNSGLNFPQKISNTFGTPLLDFSTNPNCITELVTGIILKNVDTKQLKEYTNKQTNKTLKTLLKKL